MKTVLFASALLAGGLVTQADAQFSGSHATAAKQVQKQQPKQSAPATSVVAPSSSASGTWAGGSDDCSTATVISGQGVFPYSQLGAVTGAEGQNESNCYAFGTFNVNDDVWFSWTADATGVAIVSTCGDFHDTKIAAYPGGGCPLDGTSLACNDDTCGLQSTIAFACTNGTSYMLQVGTFAAGQGSTGNLNISIGTPPTNDDCSAPDVIAGQGSFPFSNFLATTGAQGQLESNCYFFGSTIVDNDVWFQWTANMTGVATVSTCNTFIDTKLVAWPNSGCPLDGTSLGCNDDSCGLQSRLQFAVTNGSTYLLQVGTFPGASGGSDLMDISIGVPPPNDDCSSPLLIAGQNTFAYDNGLATTGVDGQNESLCYAFGSTTVDNDVWYEWTADGDGIAIMSTCGNFVDTKLAAYPAGGCPTLGSAVACNDDACGLQSTIAFNVTNGASYLLQVGNFPGAAGGPGTFDITIVVPPSGYAYDLGVSNNSLGLTAGGGIGWLHGFDSGGTDIITQVSSAYGTPLFPGLPVGQPATVCIWDDPTNDFNPSDATLLYSAPIVTANEDTDVFNAYPIPSVGVTGVFFVGIVCQNAVGTYPAPMDGTFPSLSRAWIVGQTTGSGGFAAFDYNNLALNDVPVQDMDSIGFPSVFLLRAEGSGATIGTNYCTAAANSVDAGGAIISGIGSSSLSAATLELVATPAPNQPAIFYYGPNQLNLAFGNGFRCIGGFVVRMPVVNGAGNEIHHVVDFVANGTNFANLGTVNFQCWYRDPAGGGAFFNLSNGLEIVFQP